MIDVASLVRRIGLLVARRSLPDYTGRRVVPGLRGPVTVLRDRNAVPHIYAESARDLFFAQGYIHAEERLFQMDMGRRVCRGRLAQALGDAPVDWRNASIHWKDFTVPDLDLFFRTFGLERAAEASLGTIGGEAAEALDAYSAGVTRYIEGLSTRRGRRLLPIEFKVLDYVPEPWTPLDSLVLAKGLAFQLNLAWRMKLALLAAAAHLRPDDPRVLELVPAGYAPDEPRVVRTSAGPAPGPGAGPGPGPGDRPRPSGAARDARALAALGAQARGILEAGDRALEFASWAGPIGGSNNWVLAGSRTSTGSPILCNDPHMRLQAPSTWFLVHLVGGPYDVFGSSAPGLPAVALGHGKRVAWGCTLAMVDDTDYYVEEAHPADPALYRVGDGFERFEIRREEIRVKGERAPRLGRIRLGRHGPILSDALPLGGPAAAAFDDAAWGRGGNGGAATRPLLAVRWTAAEPSDEVGALLGIARARDWEDFTEALRAFRSPAQNFVYADVDGHIGYYLAGAIPLRAGGPPPMPVPADGARGEAEWTGYVPFEENPHLFDPPEGAIATANNQQTDDAYPYYISRFHEPSYRVARALELIGAQDRHTPANCLAMQMDVRSGQARDAVERLLRPLEDRLKARGGAVAIALNHCLDWGFDCTPQSIAAPAVHVFLSKLMVDVLGVPLGEDVVAAYGECFSCHMGTVRRILEDPGSAFFAGRDRDALICRAFEEAVRDLEERLGPPSSWKWGDLHRVEMRHAFHAIAALRRLFDVGPYPTGGSGETLNRGCWAESDPFTHVVGASLRLVCDVGALARRGPTQAVIHTGQSGNPASPHYDDQVRPWLDGKLLSVPIDRAEVERTAAHRLVLEPDGPA